MRGASARILVDVTDGGTGPADRLAKILTDWARGRDQCDPQPPDTETTAVTVDIVPTGGRTLAWIALTAADVDELGRLLARR